ncbi:MULTISPECIES: DUF1059 domain-containing protein [Saliphagus]|uniref:DUF1059 domain-containing protein n=1 Tax=Saliphagus infecundisoli TaxID=1849069 RepID=A0ABD5QFD8_9EURY|nr:MULTISPECIES: DUF1059 domain-containing protein [Saliphagus]
MAYQVECVQYGCEFETRAETEREAADAMRHHTDEEHANMDLADEEIREAITEL